MRTDHETTSQIPRAELLGLLDTMTPHEQQRVTAEFMVVEPAGLSVPAAPGLPSWVIVAGTGLFTFLVGGALMLAA